MVLTNPFFIIEKEALVDKVGSVFLSGAVGTSSVTPVVTDVRLVDEVFRDTTDAVDKSVTDKVTTTLIVELDEANGNILKEFGWFEPSAASTGTAFVRDTMTSITKTSDIKLFLDTTIDFKIIEV